MDMSKAAVGVVAALCVAAGAGGTYLATRGERAALPGEAPAAAQAVEQSEALVAEPLADVAAPPPSQPVAARPAPRRAAATRIAARPRETAPAPVLSPPALEARRMEPDITVAPEPELTPAPAFVDLEIAPDSVLGLQIDSSLSSERARVEDEVIARVTRDVRVGDRVAIPAGARAEGEVTLVERGGRLKDRARLGVRFTSVVLADGTRVPIDTETIYREGDPPAGESTAKIGGGAIGGAIIGGILGGAKGAIIGGSAGAGAGTVAVMAGGRNEATLPSGTPITVRITQPVTVTVAANP